MGSEADDALQPDSLTRVTGPVWMRNARGRATSKELGVETCLQNGIELARREEKRRKIAHNEIFTNSSLIFIIKYALLSS